MVSMVIEMVSIMYNMLIDWLGVNDTKYENITSMPPI